MEIKKEFCQNDTTKSIHDLLKNFFNHVSEVEEWLNTPNPNFSNTSPQKLIDSGKASKVLIWLEANLEGY